MGNGNMNMDAIQAWSFLDERQLVEAGSGTPGTKIRERLIVRQLLNNELGR